MTIFERKNYIDIAHTNIDRIRKFLDRTVRNYIDLYVPSLVILVKYDTIIIHGFIGPFFRSSAL